MAIASISEEKMVRIFEAPKWFADELGVEYDELRPDAAEMPALGLSNKPLEASSDHKPQATSMHRTDSFRRGPVEEDLMLGRLWPEMAKLYAHGNDLSCIAGGRSGTVLATAARANTKEQAKIVIWNVAKRLKADTLLAHDLTVTALQFSPCETALATASRDRSFCIFRKESRAGSQLKYLLATSCSNAHTRALNCISWMFGTRLLVTGARDKKMKLHVGLEDLDEERKAGTLLTTLSFDSAVTAVAYTSRCTAVGLESGKIVLYRITEQADTQALKSIPKDLYASGRIRALHWRPSEHQENPTNRREQDDLLIGSEDGTVRIYEVTV
eukprot:Plantae.Rhodophyta-Purpureofilum_apyrenoidigerum.ctg11256.p1 GENE.Plantae.Rhodophyta-Purpureofilum_apyrenoidigerum.ctg11256~~Plantae.Rhodophyta-Purpureofilum_apyrenoidigerum.ctg11256.p1  ORF type:complete len:345 (-),score=50.15 Plantae.Rhodophyta-Purpureofilum_apyrenoidigerum.ctg11256:89-1072(-)